ncbi:GbsR/MarR family transcriptional regulator [Janibacter alittae]|uniref:MarR family transcriptional regulator n=1 Tax=Janibacter alittae TaxID=3115209 RepID=A0ABZ2MK55_9MICO
MKTDNEAESRPLPPGDSRFVEDMGISLEGMGLPRVAGRLLGWLLICDPPEQSAGHLAEALRASTGSISTNARLLDRHGLIERVGISGDRRAHYRIRDDAWISMMHEQLVLMRQWRGLAQEGLALLSDRPAAQRRRLTEMSTFLTYMDQEMTAATRRYREEKETNDE